MFCSSLRRRPVWASIPATLLSLHDPKWSENNLQSHDIQIPVPKPKWKDVIEMFNIILLSSCDMQPSTNAIARVEQLYQRTGGSNIGVILLLQEESPQSNGTMDFMELQMGLQHLDIPIIPLATISNIQTTLSHFQRQLFISRSAVAGCLKPNPAVTLLPHCSTSSIPDHARNILSDICDSIPGLSQAATTQEGQMGIRQWLSDSTPQVAEDIIGFFEQDFIVD